MVFHCPCGYHTVQSVLSQFLVYSTYFYSLKHIILLSSGAKPILKSTKIKIFKTVFTCIDLVGQPASCYLYKENHAISYHYLVCICHLCNCCRHFTLAEWLTTLLSVCKFHNSFQSEGLCPLFSEHLHQACFEGCEPVDRQNRRRLDSCVTPISQLKFYIHFLSLPCKLLAPYICIRSPGLLCTVV